MRLVSLILLFVVLLAGCGTVATTAPTAPPAATPAPTAAPATPVPAGNPTIARVVQQGGFTGQTITTTVELDMVRLENQSTQSKPVEQSEVATLQEQLEQTGIYGVAPGLYMPEQECCDRYTYDLLLVHNNQTYEYTTMDDTPEAPQAISKAINLRGRLEIHSTKDCACAAIAILRVYGRSWSCGGAR